VANIAACRKTVTMTAHATLSGTWRRFGSGRRAAILGLAASVMARAAEASPNVPPGDAAYARLAELRTRGDLSPYFAGLQVLTEAEIARLSALVTPWVEVARYSTALYRSFDPGSGGIEKISDGSSERRLRLRVDASVPLVTAFHAGTPAFLEQVATPGFTNGPVRENGGLVASLTWALRTP
jgi:hypothetical protein